jgi:uncharacterized Zn finger protein
MITTRTWHSRHNLEYRLKITFRRKLATFMKKNPSIHPFSVTSKRMAVNWWAKKWNAHLKNYTLETIPLEKGKVHLRCHALADFKMTSKGVQAIVLGSKIKPYDVTIAMEPIAKTAWARIQKLCDGDFESFEKILGHHFPKKMDNIFSNKPTGLFPLPKEISFTCSCSNRGKICKHTAVVLYAIGAKIDQDPQLLFKLRGVNILEFISNSIHAERKKILKKTNNKNLKILKNTNLAETFNIEI